MSFFQYIMLFKMQEKRRRGRDLQRCLLITIYDPQAVPAGGLFGSRNVVSTLLSIRTWFVRREDFLSHRHGLLCQLAQEGCHAHVISLLTQLQPKPLLLSLFPVSVHKTNLFFFSGWLSNGKKCNEFLQDWGVIIFLDTAPKSSVWKSALLVIGSVHIVIAHLSLEYSSIKVSLFLISDSCIHLLQYSFPVDVFCGYGCSLNLI